MPAPASPVTSTATGRLTWADVAVAAGLGLALVSIPVMVLAAAPPLLLLAVPALFAGIATAWAVVRRPLLNLAIVLSLSVFTIGYKSGIQIEEVLYGLYYLGYLAAWFTVRVVVLREPVAHTGGERALLLFLGLAFGLTPVWFALGADVGEYQSEAVALANLAFFFPVREAIARDRRALPVLCGVVLWIPAYIAVRNLINYQTLIAETVLSDVLTGRRVAINDLVLMTGAVFSTGLLSAVRSRWAIGALGAVLVLCAAALAITQSRAMWVMMAFGLVMTFALGRRVQRQRVVIGAVVGGALLVGAAIVLLGDEVGLIASGFLRRLMTLRGATTQDISFLSRLYEAEGALAYVRLNPVLGHGLGNAYTYFDMLFQKTITKTFTHNGYVGLVYRFGLWGPPLLIGFWVHAVLQGLSVHRRGASDDPLAAAAGFSAALVLMAFVISTITANPFHNSDSLLAFALMTGMACGTRARWQRSLDPAAAAPAPLDAPPATGP